MTQARRGAWSRVPRSNLDVADTISHPPINRHGKRKVQERITLAAGHNTSLSELASCAGKVDAASYLFNRATYAAFDGQKDRDYQW